MLVSLLSSHTLTTAYGFVASTQTRPIDMRGFNYANITLNIRDIVHLAGSPSVTLVANAEGSNDGQNWTTITGLGPSKSATGVESDEGYVTFAWLRFDVQFSMTGSAGDQATVVFCLQARLLRK
jgi:hypothetical protein